MCACCFLCNKLLEREKKRPSNVKCEVSVQELSAWMMVPMLACVLLLRAPLPVVCNSSLEASCGKKYLGQVQTCSLFNSCQSKTVADPVFISSESTPRCTSSSKDVLNEVWLTSLLGPSRRLPSIPEGASWEGQEFGLGGFGVLAPCAASWPWLHLAAASTTPIWRGPGRFCSTPALLCFLVLL